MNLRKHLSSNRAWTAKFLELGLVLTLGYLVGRTLGRSGAEQFIPLIAVAGVGLLSFVVLQRPLLGLLILPFVLYLVPQGSYLLGIRPLSPPLLLAGLTLVASVAHFVRHRRSIPKTPIWYVLGMILLLQAAYWIAERGEFYYAGYRVYDTVRSVVPFVSLMLIVRKEKDANLVMYAWTLAFVGFVVRSLLYVGDIDLLWEIDPLVLGRLRATEELGNPNSISWHALLFVPICISLALHATSRGQRILWSLATVGASVTILLATSRAGIAGVLLALAFVPWLAPVTWRKRTSILIVSVLAMAVFWQGVEYFAELGLLGGDRAIMGTALEDTLQGRIAAIRRGFEIAARYPLTGTGPLEEVGTHSYFAKAAMEYGFIYFTVVVFAFVWLIWYARRLRPRLANPVSRAFTWGIMVAGLIAIPETLFGITLQSVIYAQAFWLFQGVLVIYDQAVVNAQGQRTPRPDQPEPMELSGEVLLDV